MVVEGNKFFDDEHIRGSVPARVPGRPPHINKAVRKRHSAAVLRVVDEPPAAGTPT